MILLTGFYRDPDAERQAELRECIRRNAENESLDEIHIFLEDSEALAALGPISSNKLRLISHGRRLTFQTLFNYANENLAHKDVVIANADIFFDHTLELIHDLDLTGKLLCLSRWDLHADGSFVFFEHPSSQDAWIFRPPITNFFCDFHLGKLGCDNRLAFEAAQAGIKLSNPGRSIKAHHFHLSHVHHYTNQPRLDGPTKSITATVLGSPYPSRLGPPPVATLADINFRETMGYSISTLEAGVSSHTNEDRPFTAIPSSLAGLPFTQVVAYSVSPIEIDFLSTGKLFVLVGNDWAGYETAAAWLSDRGYRENIPLLETQDGCGFEVWSLIGNAGDRFEIPTQVMLLARELKNEPFALGKSLAYS